MLPEVPPVPASGVAAAYGCYDPACVDSFPEAGFS